MKSQAIVKVGMIHHLGLPVPKFMPVHQIDVEIFHIISEDFDLLVALN